jgi:ATP-binding cassette subfamily B protein
MTSSPDARSGTAYSRVPDDLPAAIPSMWRLCKLGYRNEPGLLLAAFLLTLFAALPDALFALWLKFLGEGVVDGNRGLLMTAAIGLGASATLTWFLQVVSTRIQRRFRDRVTIALEAHVANLQATVSTIAHQELMALNGRYRTMFDLQAQRFTSEDEEGIVYDRL